MSKEISKEIFEAGIEAGKSRDEIIVEMVQGGVSLNSAQNFYKDLAADAGLATARIGFKAEALEHLDEVKPDLLDAEVRASIKVELQEKFGVASSTANDYVKAWAAKEGIELPAANFGSNPEEKSKIFQWICNNPNTTKEAFRAFMMDEMGRGKGSVDETYRGIVLARDLQAAGVVFGESEEDAA